MLVCSVNYPGNNLVSYNAGSIAYCIQTCEDVNEVYPNAPCVRVIYTPSYLYVYSCHVKYKFDTPQSKTYEVDTTILLKGVFFVFLSASATASTSTAATSTSPATADDGCPTRTEHVTHFRRQIVRTQFPSMVLIVQSSTTKLLRLLIAHFGNVFNTVGNFNASGQYVKHWDKQ